MFKVELSGAIQNLTKKNKMSANNNVKACDSPEWGAKIIWDYRGNNESEAEKNAKQLKEICELLIPIFQASEINTIKLAQLIGVAENALEEAKPLEVNHEIKTKIDESSLEDDPIKRIYALVFKNEIQSSIDYVAPLLSPDHNGVYSSESHGKQLSTFTKACLVFSYLMKPQQDLLIKISRNFQQKIPHAFERLPPTANQRKFFERIDRAMRAVIDHTRSQSPVMDWLVLDLPPIEDLFASHTWVNIRPFSPPEVPKQEESKPKPNLDCPLEEQLPPSPALIVKQNLTYTIESILDRVLLHYGETALNLLMGPLIDAFKTGKFKEIIKEAVIEASPTFSRKAQERNADFTYEIINQNIALLAGMTTQMLTNPDNNLGFIRGITKLISPFCFKTPTGVGHHHKTLILNIIPQITLFLSDYLNALEEVKKKRYTTKEQKEHHVLVTMMKNILARSEEMTLTHVQNPPQNHDVFESELTMYSLAALKDPTILKRDLQGYTEKILQKSNLLGIAEPNTMEKIMITLVNHYISVSMDVFLSPFFIALLIERLVNSPEVLQQPEEKSVVPPAEAATDEAFATALSAKLWAMVDPVLRLGGNPGLISLLVKYMDEIILDKILKASRVASDELHQILSSDCVIMPFILLDKILFNQRTGREEPAIKLLLEGDESVRQKFAEVTIDQFKGKHYKIVADLIEKNTNGAVLFMAETFGNIDTFSITLMNELLGLPIEHPQILQLLRIYLTDGYANFSAEMAKVAPASPYSSSKD